MNKETIDKVENFLNKNFIKEILEFSILKTEEGTYEVFDKYIVSGSKLNFTLSIKNYTESKNFYSLRNAFLYIIFHKLNRFFDYRRIEELDLKLENLSFSIQNLNKLLLNTKDIEGKIILSAKLSQNEALKRKYLKELINYVSMAKAYQFRMLNSKQ